MKLAIIGATGLVGSVLLSILKERKFPLTKLILVASKSSIGKKINFNRKAYEIVSLDTALKLKPNIVLFSAGSDVSIEWAPKFKLIGSTVEVSTTNENNSNGITNEIILGVFAFMFLLLEYFLVKDLTATKYIA